MLCYLFSAPIYFLFSPDVPGLLYYSHIPTAIIAIFIGFFVLLNGKRLLLNRLLFAILICFSLWIFSNIILWTNIHSDLMLFVWSFLRVLSSLISIFSVYFIYVFLEKKDVSRLLKSIFLTLILPVIVLAPTYVNLSGFNVESCDAFIFEGPLFQFSRIAFGLLAMVWILFLLVKKYRVSEAGFKRQILLMGLGIEFFLFSFFLVTFLAAYFTKIGILPDSRLEYYGLFGMDVFIIFISILIVRFRTFNMKVIGAQALVWALVALIGSQFFYMNQMPTSSLVVTGITLFISAVVGLIIVRSVKKEVQQKEELEKLSTYLAEANEKLKTFDTLKSKFLSLASHQLRNPISAIINCTSMFLDGSFGKIDDTQKNMLSQMYDRAKGMNDDVEKYLTIAKVDQGGLQYNLEKLDLEDFAKNITEQQKLAVEKRKLTLSFETDGQSSYFVNGDKVQLKQVFQNLIDNAMKFTKEGWIKVKLSKDEKNNKIRVAISDSGMGIKPEIMPTLFKEFARGEGAKVDVGGSGIGIYLAKEIIEKGHSGKIWAESEGAGKGSTFVFELPLYSEKKLS